MPKTSDDLSQHGGSASSATINDVGRSASRRAE